MNGPTPRTLLMGVLAIASSLTAVFYYPWPVEEQKKSQVDLPIFEKFEDKNVSFIEVEKFNSDLQSLERINLQRRGEKWMLPNFSNFNADKTSQISAAIGGLRNKVLDVISDEVEDHTKYGVIDPQDFQSATNKSFIGKKITLQDSNRAEIASLIVGLQPQDTSKQGQRYVRIAGQPSVYLIEFDDSVLSTQFSSWVESNLLRLSQSEQPQRINIDNFRIDPETLSADAKRINFYRAMLEESPGDFPLRYLEIDDNGSWKKITPDNSQIQTLQTGLRNLVNLEFVKVRPKDKALADAMKKPGADADAAALESALKLGFRAASDSLAPIKLISTGGRIDVETKSNVTISLLLGNVESTNYTASKLCRWAAIISEPTAAKLVKPDPPKAEEGKEVTEEQKIEFARAQKDWETKLAKAQQLSDSYNTLHAPWFYAIDEGIIGKLRPDLSFAEASANRDKTEAKK